MEFIKCMDTIHTSIVSVGLKVGEFLSLLLLHVGLSWRSTAGRSDQSEHRPTLAPATGQGGGHVTWAGSISPKQRTPHHPHLCLSAWKEAFSLSHRRSGGCQVWSGANTSAPWRQSFWEHGENRGKSLQTKRDWVLECRNPVTCSLTSSTEDNLGYFSHPFSERHEVIFVLTEKNGGAMS